MGSGAPATRAVAQVVLLDGQFAAMPGVVAEGRRVIANVVGPSSVTGVSERFTITGDKAKLYGRA